jgi:hypothetical protein
MAYRNRDDRFRSQEEFIRAENRTINNSRDYPLTDEDRDRFASEDFNRRRDLERRDYDGDPSGQRHGRYGRSDFSPVPRRGMYDRDTYLPYSEPRGHAQGRDWHDTFTGRGPAGQSRFEAGGGYTEDVGGSAMQNAVRSNRGRGQTDYWEPYTDNARPFFTGAHSGQVYETDMSYGGAGRTGDHLYDDAAHDPDYRDWRENQLRGHDREYYAWRNAQARNYDSSYSDWRRSQQDKFANEFNAWRASQNALGQSDAAQTKIATDKTGHRTPAAGNNPSMTGAAAGSSGSISPGSAPSGASR